MTDVVIVDAIRSPIGRRRGALKDIHPVDLLGHMYLQILERSHLEPALVDDVIVGCVDQIGDQAANIARNAWLSAGLVETVPATTVDRQCGSSLQALQFAAHGIQAGAYDIAIAAGVESMSRVPLLSTIGVSGHPLTNDLDTRYQLNGTWFNQAVGAELIAKRWNISRSELDAFSLESHRRAMHAQASGVFQREIVPVPTRQTDATQQLMQWDEGIRSDSNMEKLGSLSPAFSELEMITAGNASQISDGASAVLICDANVAARFGWRARARIVATAVVGVDPVTMLTGPIPATFKVLQRAGLTMQDIDLFEINEAFASVVLAWQRETGVDHANVNVHGGAIALGHPLGATGTRIVATMVNALEQRDARFGLIAICEGGGQANAMIIERCQ